MKVWFINNSPFQQGDFQVPAVGFRKCPVTVTTAGGRIIPIRQRGFFERL